MLAGRVSALLCVSAAFATAASAQEAAPFVTQLRLPARNLTLDVFAWRTERGVAVEPSALATLGIAAPASEETVALSDIPGLRYEEPVGDSAVVITCSMACYAPQHIDLQRETRGVGTTRASGGYVNYEADVSWLADEGARAAGIAEGVLFGDWGLLRSSWIGATHGAGVTRLETSWTIDWVGQGVRTRIGDGVVLAGTGAPVRFGGLQIGRHFGLTPSLITHPTPALSGEAESASVVELYVDGALRARTEVAAGPFVIDHAPLVSGAGEAELVVTDLLGREQTITRPFFVSTTMLRRGLSDWSLAAGAVREEFGREDGNYGEHFAAARYRVGLTDALTLDTGVEYADAGATAQGGVSVATASFGLASASHARSKDGGYTTASWLYDARSWTIGFQFEERDLAFQALGREDDEFRQSAAGHFTVELGEYGSVAFTAAQVEFETEPAARTATLSYAPDFGDGALSFHLLYTESDESEFSAAVSYSVELGGDISGHLSAEVGDGGSIYRASGHRAVEPGRLGWRARVTAGAAERADAAIQARTSLGDTMVQAAYSNGEAGARVRHAGSVGWVETTPFAGRRIDSAFAVVETGTENVSVTRNHLRIGQTGRDGRILATNLRAYDDNTIAIAADDLPLDRAPAQVTRVVSPTEGAGLIVRFEDATEELFETRVRYISGEAPARGSVLVRRRDGARFPIGAEGRIVLRGAQADDTLDLAGSANCLTQTGASVEGGLTLVCGALS